MKKSHIASIIREEINRAKSATLFESLLLSDVVTLSEQAQQKVLVEYFSGSLNEQQIFDRIRNAAKKGFTILAIATALTGAGYSTAQAQDIINKSGIETVADIYTVDMLKKDILSNPEGFYQKLISDKEFIDKIKDLTFSLGEEGTNNLYKELSDLRVEYVFQKGGYFVGSYSNDMKNTKEYKTLKDFREFQKNKPQGTDAYGFSRGVEDDRYIGISRDKIIEYGKEVRKLT